MKALDFLHLLVSLLVIVLISIVWYKIILLANISFLSLFFVIPKGFLLFTKVCCVISTVLFSASIFTPVFNLFEDLLYKKS